MSENTNSEFQEFASIIRGRAAFYEFFSLAFREPADEEFLDILKQFAPHFAAVASEVDIPEFKEGSEKINTFIEKMDSYEDLLGLLNRSYTSLFLLGFKSIPTSESVYLSPSKLLKQEPWEEVIKQYREQRFGIPTSFKEPEDHVSMEMLFMYFLAENCAKALEESNEEQAEKLLEAQTHFLNRHIARWVPTFAEQVVKNKEDHVVMLDAIALLMKGFVKYDQEFLKDLGDTEE